tara:strand:+ start:229 stop:822 length:594 start_codon:yes stop_codon:yes gene_type:complete
MSDNIRIPVEVDTSQARAKLKQLHNDKAKSKKRITSAARRTSRMAVRAFAFTGAASAMGKFQINAPSGNVDPIAAALSPALAEVKQYADKKLGYSATARKSAREQTKAAFAITVGRNGDMAGATNFYNTVEKMQTDAEKGRNILRQDPRFIGPDLATVTNAALEGQLKRFGENISSSMPFMALGRGLSYLIEGVAAD